jgi:hypothetical protein
MVKVREKDLRRATIPLFKQLDSDKEVIGTSTEYTKDDKSAYLSCLTLLVKKTKCAANISNIIKQATGCEPVEHSKNGFIFFTWEYFGAE